MLRVIEADVSHAPQHHLAAGAARAVTKARDFDDGRVTLHAERAALFLARRLDHDASGEVAWARRKRSKAARRRITAGDVDRFYQCFTHPILE